MISFINDPNELKGRRALVTGGSRGTGGAIVRRLLSAGGRVVAVARIRVKDFLPTRPGYRGTYAAWKACRQSSNKCPQLSAVWTFW
jgi:NAD(P)-dependent dehydrogenase (short-subunit alcohol dehydrogenase family)